MPPRRARGVTLCARAFHRAPLLGAEKRQQFVNNVHRSFRPKTQSRTIGFFLPCVKISERKRLNGGDLRIFFRLPAGARGDRIPRAARKTDRAFHRAANKARHANRKLSNSNSANPSPPRFRALERGDDRAATRAARALKHARRTRKRTEAGDHKRG
jgi:hypothetical protein